MSSQTVLFDLDRSRRYWRHAPSGTGKHDTAQMTDLDDPTLAAVWDDAFAARFRQYPEEEAFLRGRAKDFAGKRVLSIGSGLGLHEIYYQLHGARMTCCDIVASNLAVVRRVGALKGAGEIGVLLSSGSDEPLGGPFDVIFIYGSLMTMPEPQQRALLARCRAALVPDGRLVLMLYTWDFAAATCGWSSREEFDPIVFARASDPSVGDEHCPWSDWHDDAKLGAFAGGELHIARRQLWQQGLFVWYELTRHKTGEPGAFFDPAALLADARMQEVPLTAFLPDEAEISDDAGGLAVRTTSVSFAYALSTPVLPKADLALEPNAVVIDGRLWEGGLSVGILDADRNAFVAAGPIQQLGSFTHVLALDTLPARYRIILSNHRAREPGRSHFVVGRIRFACRELLICRRTQAE